MTNYNSLNSIMKHMLQNCFTLPMENIPALQYAHGIKDPYLPPPPTIT